jgi:hypothetical protein
LQYGVGTFRNLEEIENFLIFYSDEMMERLNVNSVWAIDGTFDVVLKPYLQLFTVSFIRDYHIFPVVFGILKNKKEKLILIF